MCQQLEYRKTVGYIRSYNLNNMMSNHILVIISKITRKAIYYKADILMLKKV